MYDEFDILFIEVVKSNNFLYDKHSRDFKNMKAKEIAWRNISKAVGLPAADCKNKWIRLRERFSRELRHEKSENEASIWPLYKHMEFLKKHVKARLSKNACLQLRNSAIFATSSSAVSVVSSASDTENTESQSAWSIGEQMKREDEIFSVDIAESPVNGIPDEDPLSFEPKTSTPRVVTENYVLTKLNETKSSTPHIENSSRKSNILDESSSVLMKMADFIKTECNTDADMAFGRFVGCVMRDLSKKNKKKLRLSIMRAIEELSDDDD